MHSECRTLATIKCDLGNNDSIANKKTSAVGTGPSPMWQSNAKHYNFFLNIIKFMYETNNIFVTYKFEKHLWALKLL